MTDTHDTTKCPMQGRGAQCSSKEKCIHSTSTHDADIEEAVQEYREKMSELGMRRDWQIGDEWIRTTLKAYGDSRDARGREEMRETILNKMDYEGFNNGVASQWIHALIRSLPPKQ